MTLFLGICPPRGGSNGNIATCPASDGTVGTAVQRGVTSDVLCAAVGSWLAVLPCAISQGGGSAELELSYKLLEATEVGTSALRFSYIFVTCMDSVGQESVVIRVSHLLVWDLVWGLHGECPRIHLAFHNRQDDEHI